MTRAGLLAEVLDLVVAGDCEGAVRSRGTADNDAWSLGLASFARFLALDYSGAAETGDLAMGALVSTDDAEVALLVHAARALAVAGHDEPTAADPLLDGIRLLDLTDTTTDTGGFAAYLLAEAALATARLDIAADIVARTGPLPALLLDRGIPHPYRAVMSIMRVRLLTFRGLITEASELLASLPPVVDAPIISLLVEATETLVRGNAAERAEVRALADRLEQTIAAPHDYLSSGCYLLVAFGLVAVGDVSRSARLALLAGGDAALSRLTMTDRGLSFELLVAAAVIEGDLDAAESWRAQAETLLDSPIARSSIERLISRVELLRGDAASAVTWADRAVVSARADGRAVEAAEGEIVAARARIAGSRSGDASVRLEAMVVDADQTGHLAVRRAAARELRSAGRRLRPPPGSDWSGLSERERDIALMVAEGLANREIAAELHLSEHTVRAHVSRVLAAFGAASRFAVAARVAELFPDESGRHPAALTPRQEAVATRIASGAGNVEIGLELGLSVKTVEKHVSEIFRRWDVTSRVGVARLVRTSTARAAARAATADAAR